MTKERSNLYKLYTSYAYKYKYHMIFENYEKKTNFYIAHIIL